MSETDSELVEQLKKSKDQIGEIYPVIVDTDGEILSGKHRSEAQFIKKVEIDTEQLAKNMGVSRTVMKELIRTHANIQGNITKEKRRASIVKIADELLKQGIPKGKITSELTKYVPWTLKYIRELLPEEYKREYTIDLKKFFEATEQKKPQVPFSIKQPVMVQPKSIQEPLPIQKIIPQPKPTVPDLSILEETTSSEVTKCGNLDLLLSQLNTCLSCDKINDCVELLDLCSKIGSKEVR